MKHFFKWLTIGAMAGAVCAAAYLMFAPQAGADRDRRHDGFEYIGKAGLCNVYTKYAEGHRVYVAHGAHACSVAVK